MAKKNARKAGNHEKEQKEFEEEVLQIDRVTRVVKGGRRLRFRVTVAIGDKKGRVGVGIGKASEVIQGIQKAVRRAKTNLINVPLTEGDTIPHQVLIKYKAARLLIMPASKGTGVIAGGSLRKILNLAGVKNVLSKCIGSRNTLVTAQASIKALQALRPAKNPKVIKQVKHEPEKEKRGQLKEDFKDKKSLEENKDQEKDQKKPAKKETAKKAPSKVGKKLSDEVAAAKEDKANDDNSNDKE